MKIRKSTPPTQSPVISVKTSFYWIALWGGDFLVFRHVEPCSHAWSDGNGYTTIHFTQQLHDAARLRGPAGSSGCNDFSASVMPVNPQKGASGSSESSGTSEISPVFLRVHAIRVSIMTIFAPSTRTEGKASLWG